MSGGEGRSWRAGGIVLKPADRPSDEIDWLAALLGGLHSSMFRLAPPRRSADGRFVVDGWCATDFVPGRHEPGRWAEIIRAAEELHAAIASQTRPAFLDRRTGRWAVADRLAWAESPIESFAHVPHIGRLASAREPLHAPSQLIHGDLTGNVLFAEGLPPAIIDFSPYWRPRAFASAVVIADALVWEGADASVLGSVDHIERFGQYLIRALIFRLASEPRGADADRYAPAVKLALGLTR